MIFIQWKLVLVLVIPIVVGVYSSLSKDHFSILVNGESLIFVNHYRLKPKLIEIDLKKCKNVQFFFTKVPRYGSDNIIFVLEDKTLDEADKEKLRNLASQAPHNGKIAEYEVLAWADREYPTEGQKATSQEVDLAQGRADAIKDFMKKDLSTTESVNGHNMAKRPGAIAELFKTEDYKTKNTFQGTGAAPSDHATAINKIENKASKAVIFVKYE